MKQIKRVLKILAAGLLLGILAICLVYLLPCGSLQKHASESLKILKTEGENPFLLEGYKGSSLDNYTDTLMITQAVYQSEEPFYKAAMLSERKSNGKDQPIESLREYLENLQSGEVVSYSRYWHGYLVVLKPLLAVMDYGKIRMLNLAAFLLIQVLLLIGFLKRKLWRGLVAYTIALCSMFPMAIPKSLQFSSMFYVGSIVILVLLYGYEKLEKRAWMPFVFLITGMVTSYVDFLTYPVFTLGMPLVVLLVLSDETAVQKLKKLVQNSIFWVIGYAGMWAGKWVMGSLLTGTNLFADALQVVSERTSHEVYDEKISVIFAVLRNGYIYANLLGVLLAAVLVIWIGYYLLRYRRNIKNSGWWLYVLVACGPVVWYCVTANHSYIHYWFTFRDLAVTFFALSMIPEALCRNRKMEGQA